MSRVTLDDAWAKLAWAYKHFEALRPQIEAFEERDDHSFSFDVSPDEGKYTFYVHDLETPASDWSLQIGDCIHNARASLDYLAVRLHCLVSGESPGDVSGVQFPIYDDAAEFASRALTKSRKHPAFSGYRTRIEELQPFNSGNPSIWGTDSRGWNIYPRLPFALYRLSLLDNTDKHRVAHAAWHGLKSGSNTVPFSDVPASFGPEIGASSRLDAFKDGAEVGDVTFAAPLPCEWNPSQVDMKRRFELKVALDDPWPLQGVLEVLPFCLWGAQTVLTIFEPVVTHGRPPHPVTISLTDDDYYPGGYKAP